ncbi:MAG: DUF3426 domain-containing protein [Pseudomonadota bacterium]
MSLTTRCPTCGTAFRVQPAQLSARGGKVRCGKCSSVFDGVAALVAEGGAPQAAPAEPEPSPQLALFESARRLPALAATGDAANQDAAVPEFLDEPPRPKRRLVWFLASLLGFVALAAQSLQYRNEISARFPDARLYFVSACALLACEVKLPRSPKLLSIESSALEMDGRRENVIVLSATFRNQAPYSQEYPALELALKDVRDQVVARRVLRPADYLGAAAGKRIARGIEGGADVALRIHFDISGLSAVGYEMKLFFL